MKTLTYDGPATYVPKYGLHLSTGESYELDDAVAEDLAEHTERSDSTKELEPRGVKGCRIVGAPFGSKPAPRPAPAAMPTPADLPTDTPADGRKER